MSSSTEISVKVIFNGEMRRFPFSGVSFQDLSDRITELLGLGSTPIVVKYTDEDGDLITVSSDIELKAAVEFQPGKILRLEISLKAQPQLSQQYMQQQVTQQLQQVQLTQQTPPTQPPLVSAPPSAEAYNPFKSFQSGCAPAQTPFPQQPPLQTSHQNYAGASQNFPFGPSPVFGGHWDKSEMKKNFKRSVPREDWNAMKEQRRALKAHIKDTHKAMRKGYGHHGYGGQPENGAPPPGFSPQPGFAPHPHPPFFGPIPPYFGPPFAHPFHPPPVHQEKLVARHVKDVTIEDGARIPAGTAFVKTWRVRNEGAPWPPGCQLAYNSHEKLSMGDNMSGPDHVVVERSVGSNEEIDISVPLVSPTKPGRYTGYWKMRTPEGRKFGQRLWVTIVVPTVGGGSSSDDQEADKYEALVDVVLGMGFTVKRHRVFRLLQQHNGDIEKVSVILAEKQEKADRKAKNRAQRNL